MKRLQLSIYYLQELNYRLVYTAFGSLLFFSTTYIYKQSIIFIILPQGLSHFMSTGLTEIFVTYIQLCIILSINFTLILTSIQLYLFLLPGFYYYEAKISFNLLILSIFFYTSIYTLLFPWLIKILWELFSEYSKNFAPIHLTFEPKINSYFKHIKQLNEILIFSLPCLIGLNLFQRHTTKQLWIRARKITYLIIFSAAALITPPDILSQTIIALPLIFFYETQKFSWAIYSTYQKKMLIRKPIKSYKNTL